MTPRPRTSTKPTGGLRRRRRPGGGCVLGTRRCAPVPRCAAHASSNLPQHGAVRRRLRRQQSAKTGTGLPGRPPGRVGGSRWPRHARTRLGVPSRMPSTRPPDTPTKPGSVPSTGPVWWCHWPSLRSEPARPQMPREGLTAASCGVSANNWRIVKQAPRTTSRSMSGPQQRRLRVQPLQAASLRAPKTTFTGSASSVTWRARTLRQLRPPWLRNSAPTPTDWRCSHCTPMSRWKACSTTSRPGPSPWTARRRPGAPWRGRRAQKSPHLPCSMPPPLPSSPPSTVNAVFWKRSRLHLSPVGSAGQSCRTRDRPMPGKKFPGRRCGGSSTS